MRAPANVPLPQPDPASAPFWAGCAEQRLLIPQCAACGSFQSPPRLLCRNCHGTAFEWRQSQGVGHVYTYTIAHHPGSSDLRDQVPYVVVVVELDDCGGARLISNLVGDDAGAVSVGAPVRLLWDKAAGAELPRFELIGRNEHD